MGIDLFGRAAEAAREAARAAAEAAARAAAQAAARAAAQAAAQAAAKAAVQAAAKAAAQAAAKAAVSTFRQVARPPVVLSPARSNPDPLAMLQAQGVSRARTSLAQLGGRALTAAEIWPFRKGVGDGDWCGMFTGSSLGLNQNARVGLASTSRALGFFTEPGSGRQLFILDGTDTVGMQWTNGGATQNGLPTERYTPDNLPIRAGDVVIFDNGFRGGTGHIGLVESYRQDPDTGHWILTTIEGNVDGGQINRHTYDLSDPAVAAEIDGFGRPALGDFDESAFQRLDNTQNVPIPY